MIGWLTNEQIEEVLTKNVFGHIGCNDGFNTYVYPINYVYDGKYIICHSQAGSKTEVMRQNKRVCFQVDEVKNFMHWKSVMVLGAYDELENERERYYAMKAFIDRMLHIKISRPDLLPQPADQKEHAHGQPIIRPIIYRIIIDEKSGRFENN